MTRHSKYKAATLLIASGLVLSACGLRGKLQTPPPMWGDDNRPEAEAPQDPQGQGSTQP